MDENCRYCGQDATVPVINERLAVSETAGNRYRRYCFGCDRWLPMCSAKYFRTHPDPHVLPADADSQTGQIVPVPEYDTSNEWCPVVHPSATGAKRNTTRTHSRQIGTDETPNPRAELLHVLDQAIDDELDRWKTSFQGCGVVERHLIDTEQALFGAMLFICGKLYGLATASGTEIGDNTESVKPAPVDPSWILQTTWDAVSTRETDIRRVIQE